MQIIKPPMSHAALAVEGRGERGEEGGERGEGRRERGEERGERREGEWFWIKDVRPSLQIVTN